MSTRRPPGPVPRLSALRLAAVGLVSVAAACGSTIDVAPDLGALYDRTAQRLTGSRNPVIVIPGILGSTLRVGRGTKAAPDEGDRVVWGAFRPGAVDADVPEDARIFALPMRVGTPLEELRDDVYAAGVLEELSLQPQLLPISLTAKAYEGIMRTLGAGRYLDEDLAGSGADGGVDYGAEHYTCFQHGYDWRRDIAESARELHREIEANVAYVRSMRGSDADVKVDVVAHSMGGLVLRYYLRYGDQPLPVDGSLPRLDWAGARRVEKAIIVGTPNAGSVLALKQLVEGVQFAPLSPEYRPAVLGTLPSVYQLLPRSRHRRVVWADTGEPVGDLYDAALWESLGWGLADEEQAEYIGWLLPELPSDADRRRVAADHLRKCLARARQLQAALDVPATPPPALRLHLIAGDAVATASVLAVDRRTGELSVLEEGPGDGTVTRDSVLMDERVGGEWRPRVQSPVAWHSVMFLFTDHIGLTSHPAFTDNVLYMLLEEPR